MPLPPAMERGFHRFADALFARLPQPTPAPEKACACKIIAHRGDHDNKKVLENTLAAFEASRRAGAWGVELDVRWTADGVPVVFHDADLRRVFGVNQLLQKFTLPQLREGFGLIPTLQEVAANIGGRLHLMIEIKEIPDNSAATLNHTLQEALTGLRPVLDYHLLSLSSRILASLAFVPPQALAAIAYYLPDRLAPSVERRGWGGLCGHYLLMRNSLVARQHRLGHAVGTGYPSSRNCLLRELNRGIDWIFTTETTRLRCILDGLTPGAR
jgi:glycerophosphoryl diester phosphodiesterase